ncbi:MAG: hypothetical protein AAFU55_13670 [Pseudomonadota bacterium]
MTTSELIGVIGGMAGFAGFALAIWNAASARSNRKSDLFLQADLIYQEIVPRGELCIENAARIHPIIDATKGFSNSTPKNQARDDAEALSRSTKRLMSSVIDTLEPSATASLQDIERKLRKLQAARLQLLNLETRTANLRRVWEQQLVNDRQTTS